MSLSAATTAPSPVLTVHEARRFTLAGRSYGAGVQRTHTQSPQITTTLNLHQYVKGRHVGITGWLLVWLIVNALFVVWRILVTSDAETRDRLIRKIPKVADL